MRIEKDPSDTETYLTDGSITYKGFPSVTLTAAATLNVAAAATFTSATGTATITATVGSTATTLLSATATTGEATYTLAIPSGTDLSTISVTIATDLQGRSAKEATIEVLVYEIYIQ
jgi:hypothetical protein